MILTKIKNPSIEVFGILVEEPITTITNILITIICYYGYYSLNKINSNNKTINYTKWYLLLIGTANLIGGIVGHGFFYIFNHNEYYKIPGWYVSMFAVMLIERASILYSKENISNNTFKFFLNLNLIELILIMVLTVYPKPNFKFVEFHGLYGFLIIVFSFHLYNFIKTKNKASRMVLWAVFTLIIAMFVFNYPVVLNKWFNHIDFAHILMAASSVIILKSCRIMEENTISSNEFS